MANNFTSPLNNLKIASPCSQDWDAMIGDERKRFCGECKLNVYNLSGMTRVEAEQLLANSEDRLCVRFFKRADGTVLTEDCPVGWQRVKRRISQTAAAAFSLIIGVLGGLGFTTAFSQTSVGKKIRFLPVLTTPTPERLMGAIAMPTPKTTPSPKSSPTPREFVMGEIAVPEPTPKTKATPKSPQMIVGRIARPKD